MGFFSIDAANLRWIDGSQDDPEDLCLHGDVVAVIGNQKLAYADATVSATALYLLKTLTEDHIIYKDNQMLPCCGFFLLPDETMENVTVVGCPNGVDWTVLHDGNSVILETEDGIRETIPLEAYRAEVFRFADRIEQFYAACSPKVLPEDELDRNGYMTFWKEWHRRRNG